METKTIKIEDVACCKEEIYSIGRMIKNGETVAFPTETVYGLGANGLDEAACRKLFAVKKRPQDKPITELVADISMLKMLTREITPQAKKLFAAFMPGPITLVLKKSSVVPKTVSATDTVGVRMPKSEIALAIIRAAGTPVAAPSANPSGEKPPATAQEVLAGLGGKIPLVVDGGACRFGEASTVVDCTGERAKILREGVISAEQIEKVLRCTDC